MEAHDLTGLLEAKERKRIRTLKALTFGVEDQKPTTPVGASRALTEEALFGPLGNQIIAPPVDPSTLARLVEHSTILGPAIEAMATNTGGFGYRFVPRVPLKDIGQTALVEAQRERFALMNFFEGVADTGSFKRLRAETRYDYEAIGYAFWEIIRDRVGRPARAKHIVAPQMRLAFEGDDLVRVMEPVFAMGDDGLPVVETRETWRRFRTFVQAQYNSVSSTAIGLGMNVGALAHVRHRWFKEFGDPRTFNAETGELVPFEEVSKFPEERKAGEVYYFRQYAPRTPYGLPRWWGSYLSVLGAREADEVNYTTFANNMIPALAFLVSNGMFTEKTVQRLQQMFDGIAEKQNRSAVLIVEAEGLYEGDDGGQTKIDMKPLQQFQQGDALFTDYLKRCDSAVLRGFRMFPLYVGAPDELNKSIAEQGRRLTDEQVFAPEREDEDWHINRIFLAERGYKWYRFVSRTPNITDNRELIAMLTAAERTGGINPALARLIVEDVFPQAGEIPPIDTEKLDPFTPYSLQLALAMKNLANPSEPGQTVAPSMPKAEPDQAVPSIDKATGDDAVVQLVRELDEAAGHYLAELLAEK